MIEERTWKCLIPSERVGVEPDRNHGHIEKVVLAIIWLELSKEIIFMAIFHSHVENNSSTHSVNKPGVNQDTPEG
jgi:hypothetical protein